MQEPLFTEFEYLAATALSTAAAAVNANFGQLAAATANPGLVHPEALSFTSSALVLTVSMPAPFAVLAASGVLAGAHGVVTNADSQTAAVNLAGFVPGSGSVTVYILASLTTIQQQPYQVVGPPQGHPSYNPAFVPYIAYAVQVDTLAIAGSTTPADNATTFELGRVTLAAGATSIGAVSVAYQYVATAPAYRNTVSVVANKTLSHADVGNLQRCDAAGLYFTLPSCAVSAGDVFTIVARAGAFTLQQSMSGDLIYGLNPAGPAGQTSVGCPQGGAITVSCDGVSWQAQSAVGVMNGALTYQGTWNAATNTPTLVSGVGNKGWYYKVSVAGTTNLDGVNVWNVGDDAAFDGTTWDRLLGGVTSAEIIAALGYNPATEFDAAGAAATVLTGIQTYGAVGSPYLNETTGSGYTPGNVVAGSAIGQSGSWRCMGSISLYESSGTNYANLFVRIA